jgi:hypothetical protein
MREKRKRKRESIPEADNMTDQKKDMNESLRRSGGQRWTSDYH